MKTITVTSKIHRKLQELKREKKAQTFHELIGKLADKEIDVPKFLFGKAKGFVHIQEEDRADK